MAIKVRQRPGFVARAVKWVLNTPVGREVAAELAGPADDDVFFGGNASPFYPDRYDYDRDTVLSECLRAWRVNPIARNIVRIITAFVVGKGITLSSKHKATHKFLQDWWNHRLNNIGGQLRDWMDEMTRAGNMFFLCSVDPYTGMTYVRAVAADAIRDIQTAEGDVMQEAYFIPKDHQIPPWPAYNPQEEQTHFMLHYSVNRPVGAKWGEPDLAPMLPWIGRLSSLLEDRARLNRFRNAFLFVVSKIWKSEAEKKARQKELLANPPAPGSVLVKDEAETWEVLSPKLDSYDAQQDILAIKKFVAAGVVFPLHWLAEPESSTRTTAEAAGTPTFRTMEQVQLAFVSMLIDLARVASEVRSRFDKKVKPTAEIVAQKPDITERDNGSLALAANRVWPVVMDLFDRKMVNAEEALKLIYRMIAEPFEPVMNLLEAIRIDPRYKKGDATPADPSEPESNPRPEDPKEE
ncbi:MAG: hypothetical protein HY869_20965 [Chloroflexi bacterium]|nr:hypothetical protein [Chloroflexota bacterium]